MITPSAQPHPEVRFSVEARREYDARSTAGPAAPTDGQLTVFARGRGPV